MTVTVRPGIPREGRRLLVGLGASALGDGILMPLLFIYLYRVRGISLPMASLIVAAAPLTSTLLMLPAGFLVDRVGARRALRLSAFAQAAAVALLALSSTFASCATAIVLKSAVEAADWPASSSLLARAAHDHQRIFALRFLAVNAGMGLGAIVAAAFSDIHDPVSFQFLILSDACTFLLLSLFVPPGDTQTERGAERSASGYRYVLANKAFVRLCLATVLLMTVGYGQVDAGIPAFAINAARLSTRAVGMAFATNAVVVVTVQLAVLKYLDGSDKAKALSLVACSWAASWVLLGLTPISGIRGTAWAWVILIASQVIFGAAETVFQPVHGALVNELSPDDQRGRFNAVSGLSWYSGFFIGPILSGLTQNSASAAVYLTTVILGCLASAGLLRTAQAGNNVRSGVRRV